MASLRTLYNKNGTYNASVHKESTRSTMDTDDEFDDTFDADLGKRCKTFLRGDFKCIYGECYSQYHTYPKDEGILCKFWKDGQCTRSKDECWFAHSRFQSQTKKKSQPRSYNVETMGELMKRLKNEEQKKEKMETNKYIKEIKVAFLHNKRQTKTEIMSKKKIYKDILSRFREPNKTELKKNIKVAINKMIITKELTQTKRSIILNTIRNSDKEIHIKLEKLWEVEKAKKSQKLKAAKEKNVKEFLIDKDEVYEETNKITWKLPQELQILGVQDEIEPIEEMENFEITKKQVTEIEKDKVFVWRVPDDIRIIESIEDSSVMKELKKIKVLQLEEESLVKKLYETKEKIEEMTKKLTLH